MGCSEELSDTYVAASGALDGLGSNQGADVVFNTQGVAVGAAIVGTAVECCGSNVGAEGD